MISCVPLRPTTMRCLTCTYHMYDPVCLKTNYILMVHSSIMIYSALQTYKEITNMANDEYKG